MAYTATLVSKDPINATAVVNILDDTGTIVKTITYTLSAGDDATTFVNRVNTDIAKLTAAAAILGPLTIGQPLNLTVATPTIPDAVRQQVALADALGSRQQAAQCVALGLIGADGTIDSTLSADAAAALAPIADTVTSVAAIAASAPALGAAS